MKASEVYACLTQIGATTSRTEKERLVELYAPDELFKEVLRLAYDPFITFGLTPPSVEGTLGGVDWTIESRNVFALLHSLATRKTTGNEAKECVKELMLAMRPEAGMLLCAILNKDLRCGISVSTINAAVPGTIPTFDVMLAKPFDEKRIKAWPAIAEPKIDGVRVICLVKDGAAQFFSRSGKIFPALDHLAPKVAKMIADATITTKKIADALNRADYSQMLGSGTHSIALDGEIVTGGFNKTVGDVRRKSEAANDSVYCIFDAVPYDALTDPTKDYTKTYEWRRNFIRWLVAHAPDASIKTLPSYYVNSVEEARGFYQCFRDDGLEGAIIKPLDGLYEKKRSFNWLKMKAEETEDLTIIGAFEGTGKYQNQLGGLIVDFKGVEVRVGSGFTDENRYDLWQQWLYDMARTDKAFVRSAKVSPGYVIQGAGFPDKVLTGRLIEVEYHEVTPDGSLRHPRFVRFRDDKDETLKEVA